MKNSVQLVCCLHGLTALVVWLAHTDHDVTVRQVDLNKFLSEIKW